MVLRSVLIPSQQNKLYFNLKFLIVYMKIILIICGWFFVGLGFIGAFVPLMPTTVFLLIAAACFARSSDKFYHWLLNNKLLGKYIKNYREGNGMPIKAKIFSISLMFFTMFSTAVFAVQILWVRILLAGIFIAVSSYILSIKTLEKE